jgi:hypothetical protein
MCLIIHGQSNVVRSTLLTAGLIEDIFCHNPDGIGIMYAGGSGPIVVRRLPKTAAEARAIVELLPTDERELAMHWRRRTHGSVDMDNCHPYAVGVRGTAQRDDMVRGYVMHNGVLTIDTRSDETKSDTWHYCNQYLSDGMIALVHTPAYVKLIEDHIGEGNKFVILGWDGRMAVIGRDRGIEVGGLWWSNTYAWTPSILDPSMYKPPCWDKRPYTGELRDNYWADAEMMYGSDRDDANFWWSDCLYAGDGEAVERALAEDADFYLHLLFKQGWPVRAVDDCVRDREIVDAILDGDVKALVEMCRADVVAVASALVYQVEFDMERELADMVEAV